MSVDHPASGWKGLPAAGDDIPAPTLAALYNAEVFELLYLKPRPTHDAHIEQFHQFPILGCIPITASASRRALIDALRSGALECPNIAAGCFIPRHGIRLVHGGVSRDLVICFQCAYVQVFDDGRYAEGFKVTGSPQELFNGTLMNAGVPLPARDD